MGIGRWAISVCGRPEVGRLGVFTREQEGRCGWREPSQEGVLGDAT